MNWVAVVISFVFAFNLGMQYERWASGLMDTEDLAYEAGYQKGLEDSRYYMWR